jgi:predicted phosphodiesterase
MRFLHLSDTHGKHHLIKDLQSADVIVHLGDISEKSNSFELLVENFITHLYCKLLIAS